MVRFKKKFRAWVLKKFDGVPIEKMDELKEDFKAIGAMSGKFTVIEKQTAIISDSYFEGGLIVFGPGNTITGCTFMGDTKEKMDFGGCSLSSESCVG